MNKLTWYYRQPVTEDDVNYAFDAVEDTVRDLPRYTEAPAGIVGGFEITPGAGLSVEVGTSSATMLAIDKHGRVLRPTAYPWNQSIAATTAGASTAVGSGGNERWVSLFVRGGRSFVDAAVDGFGNNVRKTALETVNALGEVDHPAGAYDATAALAAGVNLLYVVAGVEDAIGRASRPPLMEDAVLAADIRLVNGQSTILYSDIYIDRREVLVPHHVLSSAIEREHYYGRNGSRFGVAHHSVFSKTTAGLWISVIGGSGYVEKPLAGSTTRQFKRYEFEGLPRAVHAVPPHPTLSRVDLLVVNSEGALRLEAGVPGTEPVAPNVPPNTVALAEVRALAGTTNTSTWPLIRRSHRRLPYPYNTMHGILEGCRLHWRVYNPDTPWSAEGYVISPRNKIIFDGEVVEFPGGVDGSGEPLFKVVPDVFADPLTSSSDVSVVVYLYACRTMHWNPINGFTSPISILASTTAPVYPLGRPSGNLQAAWGTVTPANAILIGVNWTTYTNPGHVYMPVRSTDDDWYYPGNRADFTHILTGALAASALQLPSAPNTEHMRAAKLTVQASAHTNYPTHLWILDYETREMVEQIRCPTWAAPPALGSSTVTLGQYEVPALAGHVRVSTGQYSDFRIGMTAVKLALPYARLGAGTL